MRFIFRAFDFLSGFFETLFSSLVSCLCLRLSSSSSGSPAVKPVYGPTNPSPEEFARMKVKRFGSVIGLVPEKEQYYRELHASVWPGVLRRLRESNIRNYSIYVTELQGKKYLFSYFEYVGDNFEADMEEIKQDPTTQRWWKETDPCQIELPNRKPGEHWTTMEMVFLMEE